MNQKIGTFNCKGICTSSAKQQMLVNEFELYKISALAVQETHIKGYGTKIMKSQKHFIPNLRELSETSATDTS